METTFLDIIKTLLGWGPVILVIWLFLHYRWKTARARSGLSDEDLTRLEDLRNTADYLEQRTQVLESILDDNMPDWRRHS